MSDGAPTLLTGAAPNAPAPVTADAASSEGGAVDWGIFKDGAKVIDPDSIIALDYHREWALADFPIEGGGFNTYDKVAKPFDIRVRISKGGDEPTRAAFMAAVEKISAGLDLFDVVTPEQTYLSVSVASLANQRTAQNGMGLIVYDLGLRQIRLTATATTAVAVVAPASASGASPVNGGTVQAATVTAPATQAEINAAVAEARAGFDANMFSTPAF